MCCMTSRPWALWNKAGRLLSVALLRLVIHIYLTLFSLSQTTQAVITVVITIMITIAIIIIIMTKTMIMIMNAFQLMDEQGMQVVQVCLM